MGVLFRRKSFTDFEYQESEFCQKTNLKFPQSHISQHNKPTPTLSINNIETAMNIKNNNLSKFNKSNLNSNSLRNGSKKNSIKRSTPQQKQEGLLDSRKPSYFSRSSQRKSTNQFMLNSQQFDYSYLESRKASYMSINFGQDSGQQRSQTQIMGTEPDSFDPNNMENSKTTLSHQRCDQHAHTLCDFRFKNAKIAEIVDENYQISKQNNMKSQEKPTNPIISIQQQSKYYFKTIRQNQKQANRKFLTLKTSISLEKSPKHQNIFQKPIQTPKVSARIQNIYAQNKQKSDKNNKSRQFMTMKQFIIKNKINLNIKPILH